MEETPEKPSSPPVKRIDILAPLAFVIPLIIYWRTLCPVIFYGDSGELIAAAKVWGLAFPTGYPAYLLALELFIRLPLGFLAPGGSGVDPIAWQANLLSAVFGAMASYFLYLFLREMTRLPLAALGGALSLAFGRTLWQQSLIAEVYSLNAFLCVAILYFDLRLWHGKRGRDMGIRWLIQGLALANHPMSLFFIPLGLYTSLIYLLHGTELRRVKRVGFSFLMMLLGLSLYLYLPIASSFDPPLDYENPETLGNFWKVVSRNTYSHEFSQWQWGGDGLSSIDLAQRYFHWAYENLGPALLPLALIGLIAIFKLRDKNTGFRFGILGTHSLLCAFFWVYYRGVTEADVQFMEVYYIPNHLLTIIFAVWGLQYLVGLMAGRSGRVSSGYVLGMGAFMVLIAVTLMSTNYNASDRSGHRIAHYYLQDVALTLPADKPVILITSGDDIFLFWYLTYAHGDEGNIIPLGKNTFFAQSSWYWESIRKEHPDISIPDVTGILHASRGDHTLAEKLFISALYQANKGRYDFFFTVFSDDIDPQTVDQSIVAYQRGLLVQLVDNGDQGTGLYLDEEMLHQYNVDNILELDTPTFDFYETELYGRYAMPFYNYGRYFTSVGDWDRGLEFFALARPFLIGVDSHAFTAQMKNEIGLAHLWASRDEKDPAKKLAHQKASVDIYKELTTSFPDVALYHSALAKLYYTEGKLQEAGKEVDIALRLEPDNPILKRLSDAIHGTSPAAADSIDPDLSGT